MPKIAAGDILMNQAVVTMKKGEANLFELLGQEGKTAIVFLRYYGCTLCQYDLMQYQKDYSLLRPGKEELVVVLQSTAESIARQSGGEFPFDIICDPEGKLYKAFEILPAEDLKMAIGPDFADKKAKMEAAGLHHGDYEGEERQLPAYFIVDAQGKVLTAHYSKTLTDVPDIRELQRLFG